MMTPIVVWLAGVAVALAFEQEASTLPLSQKMLLFVKRTGGTLRQDSANRYSVIYSNEDRAFDAAQELERSISGSGDFAEWGISMLNVYPANEGHSNELDFAVPVTKK